MSGIVRMLAVILFHSFCIVQCGRVKRVIGGHEVACGTQPRVASLRKSTGFLHICGATLLNARFALTAAHCLEGAATEYILRLNNFCSEHAVSAEVLDITLHDSYDKVSRAHDIALMRISLPIDDTSWLDHSILPTLSFGLSGNCTIYGFGYREVHAKETSEKLLAGEMKLVSLDECMEALGPYVAPKPDRGMLCAMGDGVDSCQGDSGAPLICSEVVEAVSSYGMSCGVPGLPGVYTSVSRHLGWIRTIIDNEKL